jgi:uncharacterized protein YecE (DUF72 family)
MSTTTLFGPAAGFDRERLARRLRELAGRGVWIGTSSWKYPGWIGQIYTRERYLVRGRFSQRLFEAAALAEYAETFPAVCGDFSFYQFPSEDYWRRLFGSAPATLRYAFKVPEEITVKTFPSHARYGARAGLANPSFLNAALLADAFLAPLEPFRERICALVFEFGAFSRAAYPEPRGFLDDLARFLAALPRGWRYSVEVRNPEYLQPAYFACLRTHGAAHVFNAWTRMPELSAQIAISEAWTADFTLCRALLRPGRSYEQAVKAFEPYDRMREVYEPARRALREIIARAAASGQPAFVFVNNRLEGNAPQTIEAVMMESCPGQPAEPATGTGRGSTSADGKTGAAARPRRIPSAAQAGGPSSARHS